MSGRFKTTEEEIIEIMAKEAIKAFEHVCIKMIKACLPAVWENDGYSLSHENFILNSSKVQLKELHKLGNSLFSCLYEEKFTLELIENNDFISYYAILSYARDEFNKLGYITSGNDLDAVLNLFLKDKTKTVKVFGEKKTIEKLILDIYEQLNYKKELNKINTARQKSLVAICKTTKFFKIDNGLKQIEGKALAGELTEVLYNLLVIIDTTNYVIKNNVSTVNKSKDIFKEEVNKRKGIIEAKISEIEQKDILEDTILYLSKGKYLKLLNNIKEKSLAIGDFETDVIINALREITDKVNYQLRKDEDQKKAEDKEKFPLLYLKEIC